MGGGNRLLSGDTFLRVGLLSNKKEEVVAKYVYVITGFQTFHIGIIFKLRELLLFL